MSKAEVGTLKANVPIINELYLRFANDYLYISQSPKNLDAKGLIAPKTFFVNDDGSLLSVAAHLDRIPAELKTLVHMQERNGLIGLNLCRAARDWKPAIEMNRGINDFHRR